MVTEVVSDKCFRTTSRLVPTSVCDTGAGSGSVEANPVSVSETGKTSFISIVPLKHLVTSLLMTAHLCTCLWLRPLTCRGTSSCCRAVWASLKETLNYTAAATSSWTRPLTTAPPTSSWTRPSRWAADRRTKDRQLWICCGRMKG